MHINGAHKNNNDNNTTQIFIGLNRTIEKDMDAARKRKCMKRKNDALKQMHFNEWKTKTE
jgi:hypothetical protein